MALPLIYILNGPNINMTGRRDAAVYGAVGYDEMNAQLAALAADLGVAVDIRQSNHEGQLIDWLHDIADKAAPVIINAGGLTHTSVALRDALDMIEALKVEVHMSNIHAREDFRHHSMLSEIVDGVIAGFGADSYALALRFAAQKMTA